MSGYIMDNGNYVWSTNDDGSEIYLDMRTARPDGPNAINDISEIYLLNELNSKKGILHSVIILATGIVSIKGLNQ